MPITLNRLFMKQTEGVIHTRGLVLTQSEDGYVVMILHGKSLWEGESAPEVPFFLPDLGPLASTHPTEDSAIARIEQLSDVLRDQGYQQDAY